MSIENGSTSNADEVMNAMGSLFNDTAQNLFNSAYIGFDSKLNGTGSPNLNNVDYSIFSTDSMSTTGNIEYDSTNEWYWGPTDLIDSDYITYDEFNDSSVNNSLWSETIVGTGPSITEDTDNITIKSEITSDNSAATRTATLTSLLLDFSVYNSVTIDIPSWDLTTSSDSSANINISFGGHNIFNQSISASSSDSGSNYNIQIIKISDTGIYYRIYNGSSFGSWIYTTISSTVLFFKSTGITSDTFKTAIATIVLNNVRYNTVATSLSSTTDYIQSSGITSSSTVTNIIPIVNSNNVDGSTQIYLSSDGTNFELATNKQIYRPSITGTNPKIRILNKGINLITEYAIKYNLY